jgi:hypothetical protein
MGVSLFHKEGAVAMREVNPFGPASQSPPALAPALAPALFPVYPKKKSKIRIRITSRRRLTAEVTPVM